MNAIETHELTRAFGALVAVDKLTLAIPQGAVFGFLGPNGAGKTTTVRMLAALIAPTGGTATVAGHELGRDNMTIRRSVGILTETPGVYDRLSALPGVTVRDIGEVQCGIVTFTVDGVDAQAVRDALRGPISPKCPASWLRKQAHATLFLDSDSASLL